jgi:hypothetical protein
MPADAMREELIRQLAVSVAAGTLDASEALPAIRDLAGAAPAKLDLLAAMQRLASPALQPLIDRTGNDCLAAARRWREALLAGEPVPDATRRELAGLPATIEGWADPARAAARLAEAVRLLRDRLWLDKRLDRDAAFTRTLEQSLEAACARLLEMPAVWEIVRPREVTLVALRSAGDPVQRATLETLLRAIDKDEERQRAAAARAIDTGEPLGSFDAPAHLELIAARCRASSQAEVRRRLLDALVAAQNEHAIPQIRAACREPWEKKRAAIALTLRFGEPFGLDWSLWDGWLAEQDTRRAQCRAAAFPFDPLELLLLWTAHAKVDASTAGRLREACRSKQASIGAEQFVERWQNALSPAETAVLLRGGSRPAPTAAATAAAAAEPAAPATPAALRRTPEPPSRPPQEPPAGAPDTPAPERARPVAEPAAVAPPPQPPAPPGPSLWRDHLQGFFAENGYMAAGVLMVVLGSSLLAYFTWDKHWLVRYTIMPSLLGLFTFALAEGARWIEKRDESFRGTGATLRGAAIALLPANFMAVALLAGDPEVTLKAAAVPTMAVAYLSVFGWGLARWCRAVHPALGGALGASLLAINALVLLRPSVGALAGVLTPDALRLLLAAGFHAGFALLAVAIVRLGRGVLTRELLLERRVPWFALAALGVTYLEVFAWVYGSLRSFPPPHMYAVVTVLAGALVLFVERRFLLLASEAGPQAAESFLGYAIVLLGILMGAGEPYVRIAALGVAGVVWLQQSASRADARQYWIAVSLLVLASASLGLLPAFPAEWLGVLGLALAVSVVAVPVAAGVAADGMLLAVCREMQLVVAMLAAAVAVLVQWDRRSWPLGTALQLLAIAVLFAWRARRDSSLRLVHTAAILVALLLPYLGFADVLARRLEGNTMAFGLALASLLWIALLVWRPSPLLLRARSTVLVLYGGIALTGMLMRVLVERASAPAALSLHSYLDFFGPLLMAIALVFATYYSRSLVPAAMAAAIVVILFPELRAGFRAAYPALGWGTGHGSAWSALALVLVCFRLRAAPSLRNLGEGDLFLGREPLPFRRFDHTLFTTPLLLSALFLVVKVDTWTLLRQLGGQLPTKTAIALAVTGATWTLAAAYARERAWAGTAVHFGWFFLMLGALFGLDEFEPQWRLLAAGLALQAAEVVYRRLVVPRHPWAEELLAGRTRRVLRTGSLSLALVCSWALLEGTTLSSMHALAAFVALQLGWHALTRRTRSDGAALFVLAYAALLAVSIPGNGSVLARFSLSRDASPTLWLIVAVQLAQLALESKRAAYEPVAPLLVPAQAGVTTLTVWFGLVGLGDALFDTAPSLPNLLLGAALLLTARAHASGALALNATLLAYVVANNSLFDLLRSTRLAALDEPWRIGVLALVLAVLGHAGSLAAAAWPRVLRGPFGFAALRTPALPWLYVPAGALAVHATLRHTLEPSLRDDALQLAAPFLAALSHALVGWSAALPPLFASAAVMLGIGNIHAARVLLGEPLRDGGVSDVHLVALGLVATLLEGTLIRLLARSDAVTAFVNRASLVAATLVLTLLSANYFAHPNLEEITPLRFVVSGVMAYGAGLYFRRAARRAGAGDEELAALCEGLYHFGVAMAAWCAALLIPFFRQPGTVLIALGLPAVYFYLRSEWGARIAERYRSSASVLGFLLLALYALRPVFQMILFPETAIRTEHYHVNAPFLAGLSLLLLRLRGLGGTDWLAFYGGVGLIVASYFGLTAWPGLSPFEDRIAAAWCGLVLAHFWTVASARRSPVRSALQRLANLDDEAWLGLRVLWGRVVLFAAQTLALLALAEYQRDTYSVAPLLLGAASLWVHQGVLKGSGAYHAIASGLAALAVHADFAVPSYLPRDRVVWVVLALWSVLILAGQRFAERLRPAQLGPAAAVLAATVFAHVLYHHPGSSTGLAALALMAVLAAHTPREAGSAVLPEERLSAGLLLAVPAWLVYFSQARLRELGAAAALETWPLLATVAALLLTGLACQGFAQARPDGPPETRAPLLFHQMLKLAAANGAALHAFTLRLGFGVAVFLQLRQYGSAYPPGELTLFLALYAALAWSWYREGLARSTTLAFALAELSVLLALMLLRRQLMLTTSFWTPQYDVWASLAASLLLAGAKDTFDKRPPEQRTPLIASSLLLPVASIVWTLVHGLGSDVALIVVGLNSLIFAYLGREQRESPYNVIATTGFVAFVLIVFWSKLGFRVLHAYTVPVGLGVLLLVQMFGGRLPADTRNRIRLVTLLTMLGSSGYYALADDRYPLAFNVTLLLLCLGAMGLGSLLRVRLYLVLGFFGLVVDLLSLTLKVLVHMDRGARMTSVGALVLLLGVSLVGGAVYYKTHREELDAWADALRARLGGWE